MFHLRDVLAYKRQCYHADFPTRLVLGHKVVYRKHHLQLVYS